jgi:hypothetical protein
MDYVWIALVCIVIDMVGPLTVFLLVRRKRRFALKNVYNALLSEGKGFLFTTMSPPWLLWALLVFYYHETNYVLFSILFISFYSIPLEIMFGYLALYMPDE